MNGSALHVNNRTNFVVVAKSPIQRMRNVARERGWKHHRLLSSEGTSFNRDYRGEDEDGNQQPALNVFTRRKGKIYHTYNTELMFTKGERGQDPRHVDLIWPIWNLLDYTPEGRGKDWRPKLRYP